MERKFSSAPGLQSSAKLALTGWSKGPSDKEMPNWKKIIHLSCRFYRKEASFSCPFVFSKLEGSHEISAALGFYPRSVNSQSASRMISDNVNLFFAPNSLVCCPRDFLVGKDRCAYALLIFDIVKNC